MSDIAAVSWLRVNFTPERGFIVSCRRRAQEAEEVDVSRVGAISKVANDIVENRKIAIVRETTAFGHLLAGADFDADEAKHNSQISVVLPG